MRLLTLRFLRAEVCGTPWGSPLGRSREDRINPAQIRQSQSFTKWPFEEEKLRFDGKVTMFVTGFRWAATGGSTVESRSGRLVNLV